MTGRTISIKIKSNSELGVHYAITLYDGTGRFVLRAVVFNLEPVAQPMMDYLGDGILTYFAQRAVKRAGE